MISNFTMESEIHRRKTDFISPPARGTRLRHGEHREKYFIRSGDDDRIKKLPPFGNICTVHGQHGSSRSKEYKGVASKRLRRCGLSVPPDKRKKFSLRSLRTQAKRA